MYSLIVTSDIDSHKSWEPFQNATTLESYAKSIGRLIGTLWKASRQPSLLQLQPSTLYALTALSQHQPPFRPPGPQTELDTIGCDIVHDVLRSLFFLTYPLLTPNSSIPIFVYWTLKSMMRTHMQFQAPGVASKCIAELHFAMRCAVYYEVRSSEFDLNSFVEETRSVLHFPLY